MCSRRAELLEQSRAWITPETLDARINEALDNPVQLYDEVGQSDWKYRD